MTTTTNPLPIWLSPEAMPPTELLARVDQAIAAFADVQKAVQTFVGDHRKTLFDYDEATRQGFPDDVWHAIDEITGFDRLRSAMYEVSQLLHAASELDRECVNGQEPDTGF